MKSSSLFLMATAVLVLAFGSSTFQSSKNDSGILSANLLAAIELESKFITTCGNATFEFGPTKARAPLFEGLGSHTFPISSTTEMAQRYFNQGLNLTYGFNHTEAHRSFKEASKLSPNSPMTYWGQAYAIGPNINDPEIDQKRRQTAFDNLKLAADNLKGAPAIEQALIKALQKRYRMSDSAVQVENHAYMQEMKKVAVQFLNNADVQALYAAAIMNTMPWDYWTHKSTPRTNTLAAKSALDQSISINAQHPGAHHYRIHLLELPFPDEASESGDALGPLMPGAGHMVHMPSHAYIRVGRYKDAAEANLKAIAADEAYISQCYSQGIYPLGYYPHNIHFLWSAATQMGDRKTALAAARKTAEKVSIGLLEGVASFQEFAAIPYQAYVRFGEWNALLTSPDPGSQYPHLKVYWHYGRGLAFLAKGNLEEASEEHALLQAMSEDKSLGDLTLFAENTTAEIARIAYNIVGGELSSARGDSKSARQYFLTAIKAEDALFYSEPPAWHLSTRLNYGDFLVEEGQYEEAVEVFQEDLSVWKSSGWALHGLYNAYKGLGQEAHCKDVQNRLKESWKYADISIESATL